MGKTGRAAESQFESLLEMEPAKNHCLMSVAVLRCKAQAMGLES